MRSKLISLALLSLCLAPLSAKSPYTESTDRVIRFNSIEGNQDIQECITIFRSVADIQQATQLTGQPAIALRGTAAQIALAEWIAKELDSTVQAGTRQYRISDSPDSVRIFRLEHRDTPQSLNEAATLIRSLGEMRRLFTYAPRQAIILRGTPDQIALAEWLVGKLDTPTDRKETNQHRIAADDIVRVFFLQHSSSVQELNELATMVRSTGELRRLFVDSHPKAIAVRGTAEQIALTAWMINELDQAAQSSEQLKREYRLSSAADDYVRLFSVTHADTPKNLNEIATQVRTTGQLRRVFTFNPQKAVAVRGTASQIAAAEGLLMQFDR